MSTNRFFVSGTDTDVGKTYVSRLLLQRIAQKGYSTLGFKPISAGCAQTDQGLRNEDALILKAASSIEAVYEDINPIAFEPPIAPHIAAELAGTQITLQDLQKHLAAILAYKADVLLIEGAGGWRLPLNKNGSFLSDFAISNQIPVVLVVGMRLGCLNHALLTLQAIENDGLRCVGWIANQLSDDMPVYQENLSSLKSLMHPPLLAEVAYTPNGAEQSSMQCFDEFDRVFGLHK